MSAAKEKKPGQPLAASAAAATTTEDLVQAAAEHAKRLRDLSLSGVPDFVGCLVGHLNAPVLQIHSTQQEIEQEAKLLQAELSRLNTNTAKLGRLVRLLQDGIKEVGDFENYLAVVEGQVDGLAADVALLLDPAASPPVPVPAPHVLRRLPLSVRATAGEDGASPRAPNAMG